MKLMSHKRPLPCGTEMIRLVVRVLSVSLVGGQSKRLIYFISVIVSYKISLKEAEYDEFCFPYTFLVQNKEETCVAYLIQNFFIGVCK